MFAYHLFSIRVIVRATFALAALVALAMELYSLALSSLAHLLPLAGNAAERGYAATAFVLIVNAFTRSLPADGWGDQPALPWKQMRHYPQQAPRRGREAGEAVRWT